MIDNYYTALAHFRLKAIQDFFADDPKIVGLDKLIDEIIKETTNDFERLDFRRILHGNYRSGLVVSFVRSYYITKELIFHSELIEATTLMRKQLELISRFNELLINSSDETLDRKTPNLKHLLTQIRKLYSEQSEIAHSASSKSLLILGSINFNSRDVTPLFPVFSKNTVIAYHNNIVIFIEYLLSLTEFTKELELEEKVDRYEHLMIELYNMYNDIYPESRRQLWNN